MEQSKENGHLSLDAHREATELTHIGNRALGIPNAYSHHGRLYFERPSGEITNEDPFEQV
ncbi:MAG: hypothetical protein AAFP18_04960 [Bacteroidota bacterium]